MSKEIEGADTEGQIAQGCHYGKACDNEACFCDVLEQEAEVVDEEWDIPTQDYIPSWEDRLWGVMGQELGGEG